MLILDKFFLKYEGGRGQIDCIPRKTALRKPSLIRVNDLNLQYLNISMFPC